MKRRAFLGRVTLATGAVAIPTSAFAIHKASQYTPVHTSFTRNPALTPVPGMENYEGTPLDQKGLFINEEHVFWPNIKDLLKWKTGRNPYKEQKKKEQGRLEVIQHRTLNDIADNSITWLGHAAYLVHLDGLRILLDPVITDPGMFLERLSAVPLDLPEFKDIDYILISHNHRDHCDKGSVELLAQQNPGATWLCGLGLDTLLLNKWTGSIKVQAAGWYQQYNLPSSPVQISFLPTRHWSRRGFSDTNASLWGAFMLESKDKKIYFGGDSGYGSHLKKVHELFGPVDYYLAGVGRLRRVGSWAPRTCTPRK